MDHLTSKDFMFQEKTVVTIGNFDGLHRGHCLLIERCKTLGRERGLAVVLLSFDPHPVRLLRDDTFQTILSREEKRRLLAQLGIDFYVEYPFDWETAQTPPDDFCKEVLFQRLQCKALVVGSSYAFGKERMGNEALLQRLGTDCGVDIFMPPDLMDGADKVSSTRIRNCIRGQDFEQAAALMGRPYFLAGTVARGKRLGRTIGFPTVNLVPDPAKLLPPDGVYLTKTRYDGHVYNSLTNIGCNPTVGGLHKTIETFIFDLQRQLYGEEIEIDFVQFLRGEMRFESIEQLKCQIRKDMDMALRIISAEGEGSCPS